MKKKLIDLNLILRKWKRLTRSSSSCSCNSSSSSSRSKELEQQKTTTVLVGSARRQYEISSRHLNHPLLNALMEHNNINHGEDDYYALVRCEVVLFDHLLWMLDNAQPQLAADSVQELVQLYAIDDGRCIPI